LIYLNLILNYIKGRKLCHKTLTKVLQFYIILFIVAKTLAYLKTTSLPFSLLQHKDYAICTIWHLKCIPNVKSNACNKVSVTHTVNQVSWLMGNTCKKPSVKRNTCSKPSVIPAINQVSWLMRNTCSKPSVTHEINQVSWLMRSTCNKSSVKKNTCNKQSVTHAINQVSWLMMNAWNKPSVKKNKCNNQMLPMQ